MVGLMERRESRGDEDRRVEERGDGGLLKRSGIQASQRKEINGVCLSVTVALCARRPLVKCTPHIWHKGGAWGTNPSPTLCHRHSGGRKFLMAQLHGVEKLILVEISVILWLIISFLSFICASEMTCDRTL